MGQAQKNSFDVLIDTSGFIAYFRAGDMFHAEASDLFDKVSQEQLDVATTNLILMETATVLSFRDGHETAKHFLDTMDSLTFPVIQVDMDMQQQTIALFKQQAIRGTSMVDCSSVVVMERLHIPRILTFDAFFKQVKLKRFA